LTQFRFVHTADIHLDSPLKGLAGHQGAAAGRIRTATRDAFENLVSLAIEEDSEFVVIAGDLYDGDWRAIQTGLFFVSQMGRLHKAGIPVFLSYGNHDAESQITRRLVLPENVNVFPSNHPRTFQLGQVGVALHGQSFGQRDVTDNLALGYPEPVSGLFNIGVLHTALGGREGHENYAPCSLKDLIQKGYDYWALGHVHQAEVVHERPHVVFPGNLQGRHVRETGNKGAFLVTVEDRQVVDISSLDADVIRWVVLPVALGDATSYNDAVALIQAAMENTAANQAEGRMLACRIELEGRTRIHEQLLASEDHLLAEARSGALGLGDEVAWVEKVVVGTEPEVDAQTLAEREDAIGELQRMLGQAAADEELLQQLEDDVGEMARRLPHEARAETTDSVLRAAVDGNYAGLIDGVGPYLSARLMAEED
jgi:DNA repair exonuclease SbcCD nuclease subunit